MADTGSSRGSDDPTQIQLTPVRELAGLTLCNRYRLVKLIGAGGMAQVWEATDNVLGRRVAVKVLHPHLAGDQVFVARFRAEAVAAARLSHQNIVGVYDTCSDGGHEAIVMELLEATTLRKYLDEHHVIDADTTVRIALRLLDALEAAHRSGLVHRDVKPSNILLCDDGRVKIADFGIAKTDDQTELTQDGALVGTAAYLAPEQLLSEAVDGRTDLYSLGVVLYECLTGTVPFKGESSPAVALARLHSDPIDPRRVRSDVPAGIASAIMRVLARNPDDRFDSAADLRAALLDTGVTPPRPPVTPRPATTPTPAPEQSFSRSERKWLYPAMFILLVGGALATAGLLAHESSRAARPDSTTTTDVSTTVAPPSIAQAEAFDPQGDGHENDSMAGWAIDGDRATVWRTEGYKPPGFTGGKTGVGLILTLSGRSELSGLTVHGSDNGWSARVFVLDGDAEAAPDPASAPAAGTLKDFDGSATLQLNGPVEQRTGSKVLIWIDELGGPAPDGKFRVQISDVAVHAEPAP